MKTATKFCMLIKLRTCKRKMFTGSSTSTYDTNADARSVCGS